MVGPPASVQAEAQAAITRAKTAAPTKEKHPWWVCAEQPNAPRRPHGAGPTLQTTTAKRKPQGMTSFWQLPDDQRRMRYDMSLAGRR